MPVLTHFLMTDSVYVQFLVTLTPVNRSPKIHSDFPRFSGCQQWCFGKWILGRLRSVDAEPPSPEDLSLLRRYYYRAVRSIERYSVLKLYKALCAEAIFPAALS